jgi:hypothetical protein
MNTACRFVSGAICLFLSASPAASSGAEQGETLELSADVIQDKIRGGLLGQLLGNLNGLPYEFKFNEQPGDVQDYVPQLRDGARTDDDTDIEWVYVVEMDRSERLLVLYPRIRELWLENMAQGVWVANRHAWCLMRLGIEPPLTGQPALNPRSKYNISGQFVCETFGLIAPAMPQTASRIGLHYTRVSIDGEPAQATQLFTTMIATAFATDRLDEILDAGEAAVDPASQIAEIVATTRGWHQQHPEDWRATRQLIQDKYFAYPGGGNGYGVCTAATVAALLYGQGDFAETLRLAFNLGWDADNNAATAGTIIGVIRGRQWMLDQGWEIGDAYRNTTRPGMPQDETITRFGDRLVRLAERAIAVNGGRIEPETGGPYVIRRQRPVNVEPLSEATARAGELPIRSMSILKTEIRQDDVAARAAYMALCLKHAEYLRLSHPAAWRRAEEELQRKLRDPALKPLREALSGD